MKILQPLSSSSAKRIIFLVLLALVIVGCKPRDVRLRAAAVTDRKATPVLQATDVNTIISDSGIVRYRIKAPTWQIFDKADTPYWEFPDGVYLERFDENLEPDATVEADYAFYNEPAQRWLLKGNVEALNLEGERFETSLLYWDQKSESVYSDSSIVITRESSIIKGVGFRSNQSMTQYTILRPTGVFPIKD
ncbi:MAG: LPS export ABC transporter periplasmic protein LptC [Paludibacteraceae bacterium]|nr:LPS export ABC transporter periplasmic protein LptC [Paludibacteraceae bacterium]